MWSSCRSVLELNIAVPYLFLLLLRAWGGFTLYMLELKLFSQGRFIWKWSTWRPMFSVDEAAVQRCLHALLNLKGMPVKLLLLHSHCVLELFHSTTAPKIFASSSFGLNLLCNSVPISNLALVFLVHIYLDTRWSQHHDVWYI